MTKYSLSMFFGHNICLKFNFFLYYKPNLCEYWEVVWARCIISSYQARLKQKADIFNLRVSDTYCYICMLCCLGARQIDIRKCAIKIFLYNFQRGRQLLSSAAASFQYLSMEWNISVQSADQSIFYFNLLVATLLKTSHRLLL